MAVIYRFGAKYLNSPTLLFNNEQALKGKLASCLVHTGPHHLGQLLTNMKREGAAITRILKPYGDTMRAQAVGYKFTHSNVINKKQGWAREALSKAVVIPQMKLFAVNNYSLTVNEEPASGGLYRLELRFESTNSGVKETLATSDPLPKKGPKLPPAITMASAL